MVAEIWIQQLIHISDTRWVNKVLKTSYQETIILRVLFAQEMKRTGIYLYGIMLDYRKMWSFWRTLECILTDFPSPGPEFCLVSSVLNFCSSRTFFFFLFSFLYKSTACSKNNFMVVSYGLKLSLYLWKCGRMLLDFFYFLFFENESC